MDQTNIKWIGGMKFEAVPPSGQSIVVDAYPESGGDDAGPRPSELIAVALGTCTAMDILSILQKKRQDVTAYRLEVTYQWKEGDYPHPLECAKVTHIVTGRNIDPIALKRAIELSDDKYCSVGATLRPKVELTSDFRIEEAE